MALPAETFGVSMNADLVHQVIVSMQSNARANTAHTKDRSEVAGGGKKPWQQKGTGRARHGSSRSPIWTGGGVAHGPRNERNYTKKINKNVRAKALACVLSAKLEEGTMVLVDALPFSGPKTALARTFLNALATIDGKAALRSKRKNAALVLVPTRDEAAELSFRNFGNVEVMQVKDVNPVALLTYKYVVVAKPEESVKGLTTRASSKAKRQVGKAAAKNA